ncbi:hypothetical protein C8R47DRAFT_1084856 [Mycena vitilis]|nr:hypothetical protein C8R47DRAFT_1084856 [Mycena vitilis]
MSRFVRSQDTNVKGELHLLIGTRWRPEDKEWKDSTELLSTRQYRRCRDKLEELVLQRFMELTTINNSGKTYKLRADISKALQVQSKAALTWDQVVDYTFLSDFDILRDAEANTEICGWAVPAARKLMDHYYKLEREKEEIQCLDIEIQRIAEMKKEDPVLAYFVEKVEEEAGFKVFWIPGARDSEVGHKQHRAGTEGAPWQRAKSQWFRASTWIMIGWMMMRG